MAKWLHGAVFMATFILLVVPSYAKREAQISISSLTAENSRMRPSTKPLDLSGTPSVRSIMKAGQLGGLLYPTHDLPDQARANAAHKDFGIAIEAWNRHEYRDAVKMFRKHMTAHPDSPWAAEAALHIGCDATYNGRYDEAEELFTDIIEKHGGKEHHGERMMSSKARMRLGLVKVARHDLNAAREHFRLLKQESPDWRQRTYASHWIQRLSRLSADRRMLADCGAKALGALLRADGRIDAAEQVERQLPDTELGHTLWDLVQAAQEQDFTLSAVSIPGKKIIQVPPPAILHIPAKGSSGLGHYWVLEKVSPDEVELLDPQTGKRLRQTPKELNRQWSGHALVSTDPGQAPGRLLSRAEMENSHGQCCGAPAAPDDIGDPDPDCTGGGPSGSGGGGGGGPPPGPGPDGPNGPGPGPSPDGPSPDGPGPDGPNGPGPDGPNPDRFGGGGRGGGPDSPPAGLTPRPPVQINMINMNFYYNLTPLTYQPSIGPEVFFSLSYNSQSSIAYSQPMGNKWQFNYGGYAVVDTAGSPTLFMADGRMDTYQPKGDGTYEAPYDTDNTLTELGPNHFELEMPDGHVIEYAIPPGTGSLQPFMTEYRDPYGNALIFGYDTNVLLTTVTDADGNISTIYYNPDGLATNITDPFGRTVTFEYDGDDNLTNVIDTVGSGTALSYDADVYLTSITDDRGTWDFWIEPADGVQVNSDNYPPPGDGMWENYRITVTNPLGDKEEFFYYGGCDEFESEYGCGGYSWYVSPRNYVEWESDQVNNYRSLPPKTRYLPTRTDSGNHGEVSEVISPLGHITQYTYDELTGDKTTVTDPNGNTAAYTYSTDGNITSIQTTGGGTSLFVYAANGVDLIMVSNEVGFVTMTYNAQHDLVLASNHAGRTFSVFYNTNGQRTATVDPLGITNQYIYGPSNRLQSVVRAGQVLQQYTYDPLGRVLTYTDARGYTLAFEYNNLNAVTKRTHPDGTYETYSYIACCRSLLESITDRSGNTISFEYDAMKRPVRMINAEGGVVQYVYDKDGNRTRIIDANGNVTTWAYDAEGRVSSKTYADGKGITYTYDPAGMLTSRTSARGITTTYTYDSNYRLINTDYSDGTPSLSNTYDVIGRLIQTTDGIGTNTYGYDSEGRLVSMDGPWTNDSITIGLDALNRQTSVVLQGESPIAYTYDDLNRLVSVDGTAGKYTYTYTNASRLIHRLERPSGGFTTYNYEPMGMLENLANYKSTTQLVNQFTYTYATNGMRSSETASNALGWALSTNQVTANSYGELNQLLTSSFSNQVFSYDDDGNLVVGYTPAGHTFQADYDAENRMTTLTTTNESGSIISNVYRYGASDLVAEQLTYVDGTLSQQVRFVRSGFLPYKELDGDGNTQRRYTWGLGISGGAGALLGLQQDAVNYDYLYDGKWNVTAVLDPAETVAAAYAYDAFGVLAASMGTLDQPYRYATKPYDELTGLSDFGYRRYLASAGRWTNRDPLNEAPDFNLYGFVHNNPANRIDPFGLSDCCFQNCYDDCREEIHTELVEVVEYVKSWMSVVGCIDTGAGLGMVFGPVGAAVGCAIGYVLTDYRVAIMEKMVYTLEKLVIKMRCEVQCMGGCL